MTGRLSDSRPRFSRVTVRRANVYERALGRPLDYGDPVKLREQIARALDIMAADAADDTAT